MQNASSAPPFTPPKFLRLTVTVLVAIIGLYVLAVVLGRPMVNHWRSVSAPLRTAQAQIAGLQQTIKNQTLLDSTVQSREQQLTTRPQRVLRARTRSLAASALQSLVLELAEGSNVTISRLDVAQPDSTGDLPFDLSANGDIYGLAELLQRIRTARYVVVIRKLQIQNNSALRGAPDVLQISLSLQAPVIVQ